MTEQNAAQPALPPPILDPAPLPRRRTRIFIVLLQGLVSTFIALTLVYLVSMWADTLVMGWFLYHFIPVGAIVVGLVASMGYCGAAWKTGIRIQKKLLLSIFLLQISAYFAAEYIEFRVQGPFLTDTGRAVGFGEYFHTVTTEMTWRSYGRGANSEPARLGSVGYLVRLGQVAGFILGALIPTMTLRNHPYCDLCEGYMETRSLCVIPMSSMDLDGDRVSHRSENEAVEAGRLRLESINRAAIEGNMEAFRQSYADLLLKIELYSRRVVRIEVSLAYCPSCKQGLLTGMLVQQGGNENRTTRVSETSVAAALVQQFLAAPPTPSDKPTGVGPPPRPMA